MPTDSDTSVSKKMVCEYVWFTTQWSKLRYELELVIMVNKPCEKNCVKKKKYDAEANWHSCSKFLGQICLHFVIYLKYVSLIISICSQLECLLF